MVHCVGAWSGRKLERFSLKKVNVSGTRATGHHNVEKLLKKRT